MEERPRYSNLRDYLALFRRRRLLIAAITVALTVLAAGLSLAQTPLYTAQASVGFRDVTQDLPLLGGQGTPAESAVERAARNAEVTTSAAIVGAARRSLDSQISEDDLIDAVEARVGLQTNFVVIQAEWEDAELSAEIANAFAAASRDRAVRADNRRVRSAIEGLEQRAKAEQPNSLGEQFIKQQIAQLEGVRRISESAEVTQRAQPPEDPSSPRTLRNTALGFALGLALALVAAFVRDSLDRRVRTARDVHQELHVPVLGRVSTYAMGTSGLTGGGLGLTPQDLESFRMLRTNLAFWGQDDPPRTVVVTSGLAQEGKSTVAAALASISAAAGQRTLLVDCDLRRPVLASRLGLEAAPGISEYLSGAAGPKDILQLKHVSLGNSVIAGRKADEDEPPAGEGEFDGQLVCVTAGRPHPGAAELLASERCRDFIQKVGRAYDLVVIDTSPVLATVDPLELIPFADAVLICVRIQLSTREELRSVGHTLARLPEKPTGIVLTGFTGAGDDYEYYGDGYY